jgi:hypothetical protein
LSIAALLAVLCIGVAWRIKIKRQYFESNVNLIHQGMSAGDVVALLGVPKETRKPCNARRPDCDKDLVYAAPLDFVGFWTVSLDQSGHVIDKFHWQSP